MFPINASADPAMKNQRRLVRSHQQALLIEYVDGNVSPKQITQSPNKQQSNGESERVYQTHPGDIRIWTNVRIDDTQFRGSECKASNPSRKAKSCSKHCPNKERASVVASGKAALVCLEAVKNIVVIVWLLRNGGGIVLVLLLQHIGVFLMVAHNGDILGMDEVRER